MRLFWYGTIPLQFKPRGFLSPFGLAELAAREPDRSSAWESGRLGSVTALTWALDARRVAVIDPRKSGETDQMKGRKHAARPIASDPVSPIRSWRQPTPTAWDDTHRSVEFSGIFLTSAYVLEPAWCH